MGAEDRELYMKKKVKDSAQGRCWIWNSNTMDSLLGSIRTQEGWTFVQSSSKRYLLLDVFYRRVELKQSGLVFCALFFACDLCVNLRRMGWIRIRPL